MSTQNDCPICMEIIELNKNYVTTECGHCFHANCLMTSVAHNGFGCPYCRTAMAEVPKEEETDEDEWSVVSEEEEMFSDYALLGFRFFQNNINGESFDPEDVEDEDEIASEEEEEASVEEEDDKPSAAFVAQKLIEQGVTMEQLVKSLLSGCHDEYGMEEELSRADDDVYGKFRVIISNYTPTVQTVVSPPVPVIELDHSAQPKMPNATASRRIMTHV